MAYRKGGQVNYDLAEKKQSDDFARLVNSPTSCLKCRHAKGGTCAAFPTGIPLDIYQGHTLHDKKDWRQTGDIIFDPLK